MADSEAAEAEALEAVVVAEEAVVVTAEVAAEVGVGAAEAGWRRRCSIPSNRNQTLSRPCCT